MDISDYVEEEIDLKPRETTTLALTLSKEDAELLGDTLAETGHVVLDGDRYAVLPDITKRVDPPDGMTHTLTFTIMNPKERQWGQAKQDET